MVICTYAPYRGGGEEWTVDCFDKDDVSKRLSVVEGHVRGIKKMVEDDKACEDVLIQISAVESSMRKIGQLLLEGHLYGCVIEGIKSGNEEETIKALNESIRRFVK